MKARSNIQAFFFILFLVLGSEAIAQLSPGDLVSAHAHLEGISNCTQCHVLGDKVSNDKCLDCHKEIKSRITQKKGYHASSEVRGKDCFACHSDHHGRNFDIVRFDEERFDHQLTGFHLTGAHKTLDCNACHNDEHIESSDLRKKKSTFLGLKTECIACHQDVHQNTLSTNCTSCHTTETFTPALLFNHDNTSFPLKGKHQTVDCKSCHEVTIADGVLFQKFDGVPFTSCASCHDDVHNNQFGSNCKECHTEESFHVFIGKNTFNHNQTGFPLRGKHRALNCASCHEMGSSVDAGEVFQDFKGKNINTCATCHTDVHESRLGTECRQCHTEESFQKLLNPELFNHDLTGYALEGKHEIIDCRQCHDSKKMTEPLAHDQCIDCHDDYHKGQFIAGNTIQDCSNCHVVGGFTPSFFTVEQHNQGEFPLTGAHLATPCFACHMQSEEWTFKGIGQQCNDCHHDVHEGMLAEKYYPGKSCNSCHVPEQWAAVSFDHSLTNFPLQGKHNTISCTSCHQPEIIPEAQFASIPFSGLETQCTSCHENIHDNQFEVAGITDCTRCHAFDAWKPSEFDHNTARFVLDGAHINVACNECHKEVVAEGKPMVLYKLERFECIDCHSD